MKCRIQDTEPRGELLWLKGARLVEKAGVYAKVAMERVHPYRGVSNATSGHRTITVEQDVEEVLRGWAT